MAEKCLPYRSRAACRFDLATHVHVWHVDLDGWSGPADATLSDDERVRLGRFAHPADRHRALTARSALRAVLADVLARDDAGRSLRFRYGPAGKPTLADEPGLYFNVSHAQGRAVIAATRAGAVGIDIERHRGIAEMDAVAGLLFTAGERATLCGTTPDQREAVFYRIWTCKEALLKAMGIGIAALHEPEAIVEAGAPWQVGALPAPEGYAVALARPRGGLALRSWSWPGTVVAEAHPGMLP